jgi:hypothetical protein
MLQLMRTRLLAVLLLGWLASASAEVLIVADEFPAMEVVAAKLRNEEKIGSQIVSQKELPSDLGKFEAVMVYIHGALAVQPEKAFIEYTKGGGKLVVLHHSISSGKRKNADWFSFLGVSLPEGDVTNGGYKWIEGVTWELVNLNTNHFIMTNRIQYPARVPYSTSARAGGGLPGFKLEHSEVYLNHVHLEPRTLLMGLKFLEPKSGVAYSQERAGWIKPSGKGWIIYLMPGHTVKDFEHPVYGQIVVNAVIYKPPA